MKLNGLKGTLQCRPIVFSITKDGGTRKDIPVMLLPEVDNIYILKGEDKAGGK
jgi:hypothetical protein